MARTNFYNFIEAQQTLIGEALGNIPDKDGNTFHPTTRAGFAIAAGLYAVAQSVREYTALQRREKDREHANREAFRKSHETAARDVAAATKTPGPATPLAPGA